MEGTKGLYEQIKDNGYIYNPDDIDIEEIIRLLKQIDKEYRKARKKRNKEIDNNIKELIKKSKLYNEKIPPHILCLATSYSKSFIDMETYNKYRKWIE